MPCLEKWANCSTSSTFVVWEGAEEANEDVDFRPLLGARRWRALLFFVLAEAWAVFFLLLALREAALRPLLEALCLDDFLFFVKVGLLTRAKVRVKVLVRLPAILLTNSSMLPLNLTLPMWVTRSCFSKDELASWVSGNISITTTCVFRDAATGSVLNLVLDRVCTCRPSGAPLL